MRSMCWLAKPGPFTLVVVDTLARSLVGGNENQQQDRGMLIAGCDELRRGNAGACLLILHHLNQHGGSRGSTALPGALNTRLRLKRETGARVVTLTTEKQIDDEPEAPIVLVARKVDLGTRLVWQTTGDRAATVSLGSASRRPTRLAALLLAQAEPILLAYDVDDEGQRGAQRFRELAPRARRVRPPVGKDVGEFAKAGRPVRAWIACELRRSESRAT
jgi:hypothetical protein